MVTTLCRHSKSLRVVFPVVAMWCFGLLVLDSAAAALQAAHNERTTTAEQALQALKDGNTRFVAGKPLHDHENRERRSALVREQHPFAAVLGCSDSRVPVELLFDCGLGDLFVVRVAGNIAAHDEAGSLEYAVHHLHVPLIVVLGDQNCGAVTAALGSESDRQHEPANIRVLLDSIRVATAATTEPHHEPEQIAAAVKKNVRATVAALRADSDLAPQDKTAMLTIIGAVYDLNSGTVEWLSE